jgi:hypothetical protein
MHNETRLQATVEVMALIKRATEALSSITPNDLNASGVLINPRVKLAALKAARQYIDKSITVIERKWPS